MAVPITFKFDASDVRASAEETLRLLAGTTEGVDEVMRDVSRRVEDVMELVGREVSADLKKQLSVPVIRTRGKVIRSKPGQYPRADTRDLLNSVHFVVFRAGRDITNLVIETNVSYDVYVNATRPYAQLIENKWQGIVEQRIQFSELSAAQFQT
jgi:hypothetical protein